MRKLGAALVVTSLAWSTLGLAAEVAGAAPPPVTFATRADHVAGDGAWSVAVGDLNSDAHLDMVVANLFADSVSVLLGDGAGGFGAKTDHVTGDNPRSVLIVDLNGDTFPDLAVANELEMSASVLLGDGAGGFSAKTDYSTGGAPWSMAAGDLNGDTFLDLVTGNYGSDSVSVLMGDGAGGFGSATLIASSVPRSVALGDLDGDTFLDLVVTNAFSDTVSLLFGDGSGGLGAPTAYATGDTPWSVAVADLNGDTFLDLVTANLFGDSVSVLLGDGAGGFEPRTDHAAGNNAVSVAVGDLNGDAVRDLAVANASLSQRVSVLLGDGAGAFVATADFATGANPTSVALGDLNEDSRLDIGIANNGSDSVSVFLNTTGDATITVTPDSALVDGQVVDIEGFGWEPGHEIALCQYVAVDPPSADNCDDGLFTLVTADSLGGFTTSLAVRATVDVPSLGGPVSCIDPSDPCLIAAADSADVVGTGVGMPLSFAPPATVPGIPRNVSATAGVGQATVSWAPPVSNGGSAITGYWVTAYVGYFPEKLMVFSSTATTQVVTGLTNGTTYRFKVRAVNAVGKSDFSSASNAVTPNTTVPGAPTGVSATSAGSGQATVSWVAPSSDGGSAITAYWVTAYVGYFPERLMVFSSTATTQVVTGLTNGTTYRFKVRAVNAVGKSAFSSASNPVTP